MVLKCKPTYWLRATKRRSAPPGGPTWHGKGLLLSPLLTGEYYVVSAIPINLLTVDWLGRKWTLGLNFLGASIFCFLAQICNSHTVFLTVTLFGVRSFISGSFKIAYIYTSEVSLPVMLTVLYTVDSGESIHFTAREELKF